MLPWTKTCCAITLSLAAIGSACADGITPEQVSLLAVRAEEAPKIDGVLNDDCWKSAPVCAGFVDSATRKAADPRTVVKICYDDYGIYVAFHASHPDPSRIRAEEKKRNGSGLDKDDFVAVNIDSRHTHRDQSWFDVSPIGTQSENMERSSSTNIEFKGDWQAGARIVEDGYNVEMAIPFSALIYDDRQNSFGISFRRWHADRRMWSVWPDLNGADDLNYYAHLEGLSLPRTVQRPKLLGYILGTSGANEPKSAYQGFDLKYPFSADSLGVLSINPDFKTVEQQVESVDFSYTERLLDDSRPFFMEWRMPVDERVFYSRRVDDFDAGLKYAGANGPHQYGLMNVRKSGERNDTVAGYWRNIGERSGVEVQLANHDQPGRSNLVTYYKGKLGWARGRRTHGLTAGVFSSNTSDQPGGQMKYFHYSTSGGNGDIGGYVDFGYVDDTFNGEIGYSPDVGTHGKSAGMWMIRQYRGGNLRRVGVSLDTSSWNYTDGGNYNSYWSAYTDLDYVDGHGFSFGYMKQLHEEFRERLPYVNFYWNKDKMYRDGATGFSWGERAGGRYMLNWIEQKFRVGKKAAIGLHAEREFIGSPSQYADTRRQTWVTFNYDLTSERGLGGRVVTRQGRKNTFFMYRQQVRHGTDAYLVYGDPNAEETKSAITLKLVRAL